MSAEIKFRYYFVDEAGDLTFFDKKGRIIVGQPGASKFFMVGVAQISDSEQVTWELNALRASLMTSFLCPLPRNIDSLWTWTIIATNLMESGMAIAMH